MKKVMVTGIFMLCAMGMFSQAKIDKLPKIGQDFLNQHFLLSPYNMWNPIVPGKYGKMICMRSNFPMGWK